jgi:hypothetical protein
MDQSPKFSKDVSLFVLDDSGVVFDEAAQEIFELNATATYIWCLLEEGTPLVEVAERLSQSFQFTVPEAHDLIREALADWRNRELVDRKPREIDKAAHPSKKSPSRLRSLAKNVSRSVSRRLSGSDASLKRCYCSFGWVSLVSYPNEAVRDWVHPVLAHLEVPLQEAGLELDDVRVEIEGSDYVILHNGRVATRRSAENEIAPRVQYLVHQAAVRKQAWSVAFHAAAVSDGTRLLVLPGRAGSGKTSLTAALVHAGYEYLSDDLLLMKEDLSIEGVPFCLCIKESGVSILEPYFPELGSLPTHLRQDNKRVRYLAVASPSAEKASARPESVWVVFPSYQDANGNNLKVLPRSQALRRLLSVCTLSKPLSKEQVGNFVRWLRGAHCYELSIDSLDEATSLIRALIEEQENRKFD